MEIIIPAGDSSMDFEFNGEKSSPRFTVPSTPTLTGEYYFSAPASPSRISQLYRDFDDFLINNNIDDEVRRNSVSSAVPFDWGEKPRTLKSVGKANTMFEDDFAFDLSQEMEKASIPADELFDGGKIRPMKPPPTLQFPHHHTTENSPVASSPMGRERSVSSLSSSRSGHRATRSLSPLRVLEYPWEEEYWQQQQQQNQNLKQSSTISKPTLTSTNSSLSSSPSMKGNKKWKLKDFFLFRSASEGRATDKDPLKKYASLSFRSVDSPGSSVSSSRRRGQISAHELHYTMNRAVSEDLKKKTFLPYKQGILGRLAFNPAVHAIANGFGFSHK